MSKQSVQAQAPTASSTSGPTRQLCDWVASAKLKDVPPDVIERAKYLTLDGIACALTGAHLPASEIAARAISLMEPGNHGSCSVVGHPDTKLTPLSAAVLNSTFIQGFELDDWHKEAPLHSDSILIPTLLAAAQHRSAEHAVTTGAEFLLAMIVGYEIGPRVGNALYGRGILTEGWHSGAVFGPSAAASAVCNLYGFEPDMIEDALGIACTQACGLMSAQFESDVKRMQHGFAARNGLFGALLAKEGYIGIKKVYEREYGGFLKQFSKGNGNAPTYKVDEICKELGHKWQTWGICAKPYASMAATHCAADCIRALQEKNTDLLAASNLDHVKSITIQLDEPSFHHGGWRAERSLQAIGAQMSCAFVSATQLVERQVLAAQFKPEKLESNKVWELIGKTTIQAVKEFPDGKTDVKIVFDDGTVVEQSRASARGVDPPLSNEEIQEKWRMLAKEVIDGDRVVKIEEAILGLEKAENINALIDLLTPQTKNPLA